MEVTPPTLTSDRLCGCASTGYTLVNQTSCTDIDECAVLGGARAANNCTEQCINSVGSFYCDCVSVGHVLAADGRMCEPVSCGPPRSHLTDGNVTGTLNVSTTAVLVYGDALQVTCLPGYQTSTGQAAFTTSCQADGLYDTTTCMDVNECAPGGVGALRCAGLCVNTVGAYYCACEEGLTLNPDNRTCDDSFDLLRRSALLRGTAIVLGDVHFDGTGGALATERVSMGVSFTMTSVFRQQPYTGGYLVAKTNVDGSLRHFAVYLFR